MAENSGIEWTHHTFNPWRGCTKVSPGCANCYADTMAKRNPSVLGVWGDKGTRVVAAESYWRQPLKWNKAAEKAGERHRVFCASMADVFEDFGGAMAAPDGTTIYVCEKGQYAGNWGDFPSGRPLTMADVRRRLFALIDATPNLDWLVLTKRPENIGGMIAGVAPRYPHMSRFVHAHQRDNLWLGTSVEDQQRADERIPHLLRVPAAVRFLSVEPLLGAVDLTRWLSTGQLHWVIVGGES